MFSRWGRVRVRLLGCLLILRVWSRIDGEIQLTDIISELSPRRVTRMLGRNGSCRRCLRSARIFVERHVSEKGRRRESRSDALPGSIWHPAQDIILYRPSPLPPPPQSSPPPTIRLTFNHTPPTTVTTTTYFSTLYETTCLVTTERFPRSSSINAPACASEKGTSDTLDLPPHSSCSRSLQLELLCSVPATLINP